MFEFSPHLEAPTQHLARLARAISANKDDALSGLSSFVDAGLTELRAGNLPSSDTAKLLFGYSLLLDIVGVGGNVKVRDSRIFVAWPEWDGQFGRSVANQALKSAAILRPLDSFEIERVRPLFAPDVDGMQVSGALAEGEFWLQDADTSHPSGVRYSEGFSAALRLWNMPYRGRQGRQKRYVLLCRHPVFGPHPVIAGIIEMGDEAPFCSWRDSLLGLETNSFLCWLEEQPSRNAVSRAIGRRLRKLRQGLRATRIAPGLGKADASTLVARLSELEARAVGRSLTDHASEDRKRIAYAIRLARGEVALHQISREAVGARFSAELLRNLSAGVRAMHDLAIPRVHMEACVCGPVPPFSYGLGGKLVVAFLAHPSIVDLPSSSRGTVLEQSFDMSAIDELLPSSGMLAVTTKGLYARHAPMYNRASVPGLCTPLKLKHIQNTDGATTTFVSDRSARFARLVLDHSPEKDRRQVSFKYGSGGAKRHRSIEIAARLAGLPTELVFAGIKRPVYALSLVNSAPDTIWRGLSPDWRVERNESAKSYCDRALQNWRSQWLDRATRRVSDYAFIPSPTRLLGACRVQETTF